MKLKVQIGWTSLKMQSKLTSWTTVNGQLRAVVLVTTDFSGDILLHCERLNT